MRQQIYATLMLLTVLILSACSGHETLKAPCSPINTFMDSPCEFTPINIGNF